MVVAVVLGGIFWVIFPRLPDYDRTLASGTTHRGEITSVEEATSIKVNGRHPKRIKFRFAGEREGEMLLAMDESATVGQAVTVRELEGHAYPEGLDPLRMPKLMTLLPIALGGFGAVLLVFGFLRLLLAGGLLLARRG